MAKGLVVDVLDNVVVTLEPLAQGDELTWQEGSLLAQESIPAGHKVAMSDIGEGESIIKYGTPIGRASQRIVKGTHVHTHNVKDIFVAIE